MLKSKSFFGRLAVGVAVPTLLFACSSEPAATDAPEQLSTDEMPAEEPASAATGELEIRANGEDFVRQGFVTKDGWQVDFDHVYVTLADVTAYQSEPAFDPEVGGEPEATETVSLEEPVTVDLAEGGDDAEPILVKTIEAPSGRYNALSWKMMPADSGPAAGQTLWLEGTAAKEGETVDFALKLDPTLGFVCGDFVGDDRKGILEPADQADLEATFHFDHLFGDGEAAPEDEINTGALGFDPLAEIAEGGTLDVDMAGLQAQLSPTDYDTLMSILPSLGHVGEGHCAETELTSR
ncbi:DUF4382 domain-containing protein [Oscillatoria sp. CS-180]|uniref:DUF4382 domain-containing protein n=1 Tax=Oscillatoria sp. CS-180 TaxID=3021720 RepID=UPI00232AA006|nr:DUF4382 domain-containing protein [Oscillatoria sp. CS-180]MDB9525511.1 DUF4382 domain-containing protein [Oscillatoria sp. CS-180]